MPRNGSGVYTAPASSFNPAVTGNSATPVDWNAFLSDLSTAVSNSIATDGQTTVTANLPLAGFRFTGVGNANARDTFASAAQVIDGGLVYAADTGSATAYAFAPTVAISAYAVGQQFHFRAANTNTSTTPSAAVSSLTAGTIVWPDGSALAAGDIPANALVAITCAAVAAGVPTWHLQTIAPKYNEAQAADIASATTTNIGAAAGTYVKVTGVVTITGLGTVRAGTRRVVEFTGALILTHNATTLILPGAANITTTAGDVGEFISEGAGNWRCANYQRATGEGVLAALPITNSLGADVALNNAALYFVAATVAQGSVGTWFASGGATFGGASLDAVYSARLTDGTNTIDSRCVTVAAGGTSSLFLSGSRASPAGNLRIEIKNSTTVDGFLRFNTSGNSKDCTVTAFRIA